jgi:hypothetical protein
VATWVENLLGWWRGVGPLGSSTRGEACLLCVRCKTHSKEVSLSCVKPKTHDKGTSLP